MLNRKANNFYEKDFIQQKNNSSEQKKILVVRENTDDNFSVLGIKKHRMEVVFKLNKVAPLIKDNPLTNYSIFF